MTVTLRLAALVLFTLFAPPVAAGTTAAIAEFTAPLQTVIDWTTGGIGRLVSILAFAFFGFHLWKNRSEDKAERGLYVLLGTAMVLGAVNIVDSLGFSGAVY